MLNLKIMMQLKKLLINMIVEISFIFLDAEVDGLKMRLCFTDDIKTLDSEGSQQRRFQVIPRRGDSRGIRRG
jgi:hypothetical protein